MHDRRTVTLVSGASAEARSSCIQQMLASSTEAGRSVWLRTGGEGAAHPDIPSRDTGLTAPEGASLPDQVMVGGCICCLAGPVFRTTLVRLLRQFHWQHLILELPQQTPVHLLKVIDQLRSPPFDLYLRLAEVVEVLDGPDAAGSAWASACLGRQGRGWQWHYRDPLSAIDTGSLPDTGPACVVLFQRWSVDAERPSRQGVQQALERLVAVPGVLGLQAVLQSHRSAYDWRWPDDGSARASSSGGSGFDRAGQNLSAALRSQETVWRLDNRIRLGLAQGTDLAILGAALQALKAQWML